MTGNQADSWGYLVVWQFRPKRGAERQFEAAYGPHGVWAKFFMRGEGFIATELNHDLRDPGRYLTLDFWVSKEAYESFYLTHSVQYKEIDAQCEDLTEQETELGRFQRVAS